MAIWYNVWLYICVVCGPWYIFPVLVCLDHEKSGNPDLQYDGHDEDEEVEEATPEVVVEGGRVLEAEDEDRPADGDGVHDEHLGPML
jgi:hypothetical protein